MSNARRDDGIRQAQAARERGRAKVRSTTTAVTMASVVTAGALALALPGSTHKTSTSSSSGATSSGSSSSSASSGSTSSGSASSGSTGSSSTGSGSTGHQLYRLHRLGFLELHELRLEFRRLQLRLRADRKLGRRQPGHLWRLIVPDTATDADASASWRALGTLVQLVVTEPAALPEARRLLENDLAEVDAACSRFRADSEIRALEGGQQRISPLLAEAIAVALRAARLTDGDVDPTVGAAMSVVGYDRDFEQIEPNGPPLSLTVRKVPGWRKVRLDGQS